MLNRNTLGVRTTRSNSYLTTPVCMQQSCLISGSIKPIVSIQKYYKQLFILSPFLTSLQVITTPSVFWSPSRLLMWYFKFLNCYSSCQVVNFGLKAVTRNAIAALHKIIKWSLCFFSLFSSSNSLTLLSTILGIFTGNLGWTLTYSPVDQHTGQNHSR